MKKLAATLFLSAGVLTAATPAALAHTEPPRGSCNRGTMHAHHTVPDDDIPGHEVAHEAIPHCD